MGAFKITDPNRSNSRKGASQIPCRSANKSILYVDVTCPVCLLGVNIPLFVYLDNFPNRESTWNQSVVSCLVFCKLKCCFYTPVFRRDVLWYGDVRLSVRPVRPSARFLHFPHTWFDIMSWYFAHDFVLMNYRSSLSVVTLRQFLKKLCRPTLRPSVRPTLRPGVRLPVFRTFLIQALTYWAEILHMTLF